ncbi:MAG TPA: anthranilate synthase component I family protein, partial [Nitrospirae bacterium]|nr:anthranilate synthase component I family protein [Nitrospirota bacterium]HEW81234.1 anthranilate synthase component I family protein [Nitrospirota bacterium]
LEGPGSFLLESIKGPEKIARYSFIGTDPFLTFRVKNGKVEVTGSSKKISKSGAPLKQLKKLMSSYRPCPNADLPPFIGGAVGMISYDFVHYFERLPKTAKDDLNLPDADLMLVDTLIAIDHKLQKTFIISCPGAEEALAGNGTPDDIWSSCYEDAARKIENLNDRLSVKVERQGKSKLEKPVAILHEMGKNYYMDIVKRAKEYIKAGDIFQANLSQRVSADIGDVTPWQIYKILSKINPSPFAAYLNMGDYCISSSSPERLVKVNEEIVETRPIAGTRPRGKDDESDRLMRDDLLLNEKERAEHLMMIDLERNDLGKISDYSTVEVDELMITEDYSHVIHIVSNVIGKIIKGKDCFDAIRATFPGGTITGVPKVRCMEIIDELEPVTRGPYTGSIGYIGFDGAMDLNIIIRTFVIKDSIAYVQAGAGIVADSDPEKEYFETLKKAEALIKTLEVLQTGDED